MIVAIHQPNVLPRVKVLQKLAIADLWVVLDDVQFSRRDYQHRALIAPTRPAQPARWMTLPVDQSKGSRLPLREIHIKHPSPASLVARTVAACFLENKPICEPLFARLSDAESVSENRLVPFAMAGAQALLEAAGRKVKTIFASEVRDVAHKKGDGILQLLQAVGASTYVADSGALAYLDVQRFSEIGVSVLWQDWQPWSTNGDILIMRNGSALNLLLRDESLFSHVVTGVRLTRDSARISL